MIFICRQQKIQYSVSPFTVLFPELEISFPSVNYCILCELCSLSLWFDFNIHTIYGDWWKLHVVR